MAFDHSDDRAVPVVWPDADESACMYHNKDKIHTARTPGPRQIATGPAGDGDDGERDEADPSNKQTSCAYRDVRAKVGPSVGLDHVV